MFHLLFPPQLHILIKWWLLRYSTILQIYFNYLCSPGIRNFKSRIHPGKVYQHSSLTWIFESIKLHIYLIANLFIHSLNNNSLSSHYTHLERRSGIEHYKFSILNLTNPDAWNRNHHAFSDFLVYVNLTIQKY